MIPDLPVWISILFLITTVITIVFFHFSNGKPLHITGLIIIWSVAQSIVAYAGFYHTSNTMPPRFALVLIPTTLLIVYGLLPRQRHWLITNRKTRVSTFLHSIRLPVEIVLFELYVHKTIPELMTFSGRNFDIIMGITAPIMGVLLLSGKLNKKALLAWNYVGLALILFILANGILSAELPFQQFGFEQPNRGINYFPFILLPATVVPIVIWTHLSDIIKLSNS